MKKAPRVNWDSNLTALLLELAAKEIEEEGRGTRQLSNQQWSGKHDSYLQMREKGKSVIICHQNELVGKFRERPLEHEELTFRVFNTVTEAALYKLLATEGSVKWNWIGIFLMKKRTILLVVRVEEKSGMTARTIPGNSTVFVDFPNDYTRMKFIQSEHVAAMIMAQAKPNPYGIPPPLDPFPSDF
ncbi:hypothetical protein RHMOL_Rhmol04G0161300 [Rhododendron molle]|uniref:Uncharacterized protein n=1 Tax=Rhododendron molle TaxID=49168 RepID=A0ACC0P174_RHOML|nr:hypothetical protein RHMOL_Rhmol04G0161300 [Rhododendron molle]